MKKLDTTDNLQNILDEMAPLPDDFTYDSSSLWNRMQPVLVAYNGVQQRRKMRRNAVAGLALFLLLSSLATWYWQALGRPKRIEVVSGQKAVLPGVDTTTPLKQSLRIPAPPQQQAAGTNTIAVAPTAPGQAGAMPAHSQVQLQPGQQQVPPARNQALVAVPGSTDTSIQRQVSQTALQTSPDSSLTGLAAGSQETMPARKMRRLNLNHTPGSDGSPVHKILPTARAIQVYYYPASTGKNDLQKDLN